MAEDKTPTRIIGGGPVRELAYGENRYQSPAFLKADITDDVLAMHLFKEVSGDSSYISIGDGDQILDILCLIAEGFRKSEMEIPFIVVAGKHGNPCGAAISFDSREDAIEKALLGNAVAIMGGEVITNFAINTYLAKTLFSPRPSLNLREKWGLDIIFAPEFSDGAIKLLGTREKRRLLANPELTVPFMNPEEWMYRQIRGGWLQQRRPNFVFTRNDVVDWINGTFDDDEYSTALIAFACCWRASSNTVALAKDNMLIGIGCGQQDRIECVRLCLNRARSAGHNPYNSFFASDAFFPYAESKIPEIPTDEIRKLIASLASAIVTFDMKERQRIIVDEVAATIMAMDKREGTELLIDAGCMGGIVTADGKELPNVKELFRSNHMNIAFVNALNRGFSKH